MYDLLSLSLSDEENAEKKLSFKKTIEFAKVTATPKCILVETRCGKEMVTQTDTAFIEQVLLNIIDSAIECSRAKRRIQLSIQKIENELLIKVSDRSCPVEKDKLNRLFSHFEKDEKISYQGLSDTTLSSIIRKHISQVYGGYITADSKTNGRDILTIHPSLSDYDPGRND